MTRPEAGRTKATGAKFSLSSMQTAGFLPARGAPHRLGHAPRHESG